MFFQQAYHAAAVIHQMKRMALETNQVTSSNNLTPTLAKPEDDNSSDYTSS